MRSVMAALAKRTAQVRDLRIARGGRTVDVAGQDGSAAPRSACVNDGIGRGEWFGRGEWERPAAEPRPGITGRIR